MRSDCSHTDIVESPFAAGMKTEVEHNRAWFAVMVSVVSYRDD